MSYTYLDHEADIGIRCSGRNRAEAFEEGGRALLNLVADPERIRPERSFDVRCRASGLDTLFVEYLNEIISLMGREDCVFSEVVILEIHRAGEEFLLKGTVRGEAIDPARHGLKTEIKAATYFGLELTETDREVTLQCVLDI